MGLEGMVPEARDRREASRRRVEELETDPKKSTQAFRVCDLQDKR